MNGQTISKCLLQTDRQTHTQVTESLMMVDRLIDKNVFKYFCGHSPRHMREDIQGKNRDGETPKADRKANRHIFTSTHAGERRL